MEKENNKKINKLLLPVAILIASIILGGFILTSQIIKQNSIEKQQQLDLRAKQAEEQTTKNQNNTIALQKSLCVASAQQTAVDQYESSNLCNGAYGITPQKNCKDGKTYLIAQYNAAYDTCLQSKGLK